MSSFRYSADICECGRPKKRTSRRCQVCASAHPEGKQARIYDTCPVCGGPKTKRSKTCRHCHFPDHTAKELEGGRPWYGVAPDFSQVPEDFFRALAGFLMGEGCVSVGHQPNFSPRVDIGVHIDDLGVLETTQSYLGGSIHRHSNRPLATWRYQGLLPVRGLLLKIKEYAGPLQAIKMNDVGVVLDYIDWRLSRPHLLSQDDKRVQAEWLEKSKAVKRRSRL
jgi:hypothetical protein